MYVSVADQSVRELGGPFSVLVRQKRDHVLLNSLLHELQGSTSQDEVLRRIYRLVFPHAFAEEAVLWPVMRRVLPDGEHLTLAVEQEHQEVNELVTTLEELDGGDPRRGPLLDRLVSVLDEDVRNEEDTLLPRLQERVGVRQLQLLGICWEILRRTAPTRAHPVVARRPPGNVLAAVPLSVLDRLRDATDMVLLRTPAQPAPALRTVSGALRRASHAVERFPLFTRGEDPSTSIRSMRGRRARKKE